MIFIHCVPCTGLQRPHPEAVNKLFILVKREVRTVSYRKVGKTRTACPELDSRYVSSRLLVRVKWRVAPSGYFSRGRLLDWHFVVFFTEFLKYIPLYLFGKALQPCNIYHSQDKVQPNSLLSQ